MTPEKLDLQQLRTQSKELLKLAKNADSAALRRLNVHLPHLKTDFKLAQAQFTIARENGFSSWAKLKEHLLFRRAVELLDGGQTAQLDAFLKEHPEVLKTRCRQGEWYESGYFQGSPLLHHIAGNPIRVPLPANILEITELLLKHGADPNVTTDEGSTVIGLILTGKQVSEAGVSVPLIEMLQAAGARDDLSGDILSAPLWNVGRATAEELVRRGAPMDLRHAAGLGRLADMERLLPLQPELLEAALLYACRQNEDAAARFLLQHGAQGDVLVSGCFTTATALHVAANEGRIDLVRLMLESGARPNVKEPTFGGTAIGWAEHGGHGEIVAILREALRE